MKQSERYYKRKNDRAQWWSDNRYKFFYYPVIAVWTAVMIAMLCKVITLIGNAF